MSDSIQYRAIQSILDKLIPAVALEIDSIFPKIWNNIIRKQDLSIGPDSSPYRKAETLVSAVAREVARDITVFDKFVAILRDYPKLANIVILLEAKVQSNRASMSQESSKSRSTGAASNSPGSPRSRQPHDDAPKLALAENLTIESGLGGEMTNPSPIAPEPEAAAIPGPTGGATAIPGQSDGAAVYIHRPTISQQTLEVLQKSKDDSSLSQSVSAVSTSNSNSNSSESCNNNENLPVILKDDNTTVVPVSEASGVTQQELVLPSAQNTEQSLPLVTSIDSISRSLESIRTENERKNETMNQLEKELKEMKRSEAQLEEKVEKLKEESKQLEHVLHKIQVETQKTKQEQTQQILELESQLKKAEADVESSKKQLAKTEQQNEADIKKFKEEMKSLEKQRKDLKDAVSQLQDYEKRKDIENREKIVELKAELNKIRGEEIEGRAQFCNLKEMVTQAKIEITMQKAEMTELNLELSYEKMKNLKSKVQQLQKEIEVSQDQLKKAEEINQLLRQQLESFEKLNKVTTEPKSCQTTPTAAKSPPHDQQFSPTTQQESSQIESTGASCSDTGDDLTAGTQTNPPSDSVHFNLDIDDDVNAQD